MDAKGALKKAALILTEERRQPTTAYRQTGHGWLEQAALIVNDKYDEAVRFGNARKLSIVDQRKQSPRQVCEDPSAMNFKASISICSMRYSINCMKMCVMSSSLAYFILSNMVETLFRVRNIFMRSSMG